MRVRGLIVVLGATLLVMLSLVALRADTTRLHYDLSQFNREAHELGLQLRERELELAALRSPARLQATIEEERLREIGGRDEETERRRDEEAE